jgi:hypothetical protein
MDTKELKTVLERIQSLYEAGGAATAAKELQSVVGMLDGHDGQSVEDFIAETQRLLTKTTTTQSQISNAEVVDVHAERLIAAGLDWSRFTAALEALDSDRNAKKPEWAAIANRYRNAPANGTYVFKFKSNKEALAFIQRVFTERHEADSKRSVIERRTKCAS